MTYQPGEQPYTQPQDPWSGTQGIASAPTDPIPQPARGQFTPGVASPSVWVQETVAHSDPYAPAARGGGRGGLYVLIVLLVVVLGGAGGFGAWWAITNYAGGPENPPPSNSAGPTNGSTSPTPAPTETPVTEAVFDLVAAGTCMINRGTGTQPDLRMVACDWPGDLEVVQVIRVERGAAIPENDAGALDEDSADAICGELPRFDLFYAWDSSNDDRDFLACLTKDVRVN